MLSEKEMKLIRSLFEKTVPMTARTISAELGISVRTVKTYVRHINDECVDCIISDQHGYRCSPNTAKIFLEQQARVTIPQSREERIVYVLQHLLSSHDPLDVYDLCEELCISISTLKSDLFEVKKRLANSKLVLSQNHGGISLQGSEKDKRRLMSDLLHAETDSSFLSFESVQRAFPHIDVAFIRSSIKQTLEHHRYFANDYSVVNLVLHIAITIDRIRSNHIMQNAFLPDCEFDFQHENLIGAFEAVSDRDRNMAEDIACKLEKHFSVAIPVIEQAELALLLASRTSMLDYRTATKKDIEKFVGKACLSLVNRIVRDLNEKLGIDLSVQEFFVRFALHVKNLLVRAKTGGWTKNPLTHQIQTNYPLLYDIAVSETELIRQVAGIKLNNDEIAYIAFHLGSTFEMQKQLTDKIKAVLFCPSYYDIESKIVLFLERHFEHDLLVTNVITDASDVAHLAEVELLISTASINPSPSIPLYVIRIFPTKSDISSLRKTIDAIKRTRYQQIFRSDLESLIAPELFTINLETLERDDAIHLMAGKLVELGNVSDDFEMEVLKRENLSSTAFSTFAMPHPVHMCSEKSSLSILLSRSPIVWDTARVQLVVMLSFSKKDQAVFYKVFDPLVATLSDPAHVDTLIRLDSYDAFIDTLCEFIE